MELEIRRLPWSIQLMEIDDWKTNWYQSIKLVNWYRLVSINRWSIDNHMKNRSLIAIDWHSYVKQMSCTLRMLPVYLIINHVWKAPGTKLVKQFWPRLFNAKNIPHCTSTRSTHLSVIAFPVSLSTQEVREEALLNIRCIVEGYNLCCFEVNVGELFIA